MLVRNQLAGADDAAGVPEPRPKPPVGRVIPQAFNACWIACACAESVPNAPKPPPGPPPAPLGRVNEPEGRVNEPDGRVNEPDGRVNEPDGRAANVGTVMPAALRHAATVGSANGSAPAPRRAPSLELELAAAAVVAVEAAELEVVDELPLPQATTPAPVATTMPTRRAGRIHGFIALHSSMGSCRGIG